jgi:Holliday junction DNA helicase RuvA
MIAHLRGTLLEKHPNQAVVECAGVGYDVTIPISTFASLPEAGAEVRLRIHTHVREDAIALFGFSTSEEEALFEKLITISGVGPKVGITVLSGLPVPDLVNAIRTGDVAMLTRIPGVGRKTAERMVLELKDKLESLGIGAAASKSEAAAAASPLEHDVISALLNLGCQRAAAEAAVRKARAAGAAEEFEPLFRRALGLVR